ncbi:MAG: aryl sulfotransferase [Bacteroidota bacterium]|nr:aryl sulfotransferase [Bacteroidota bacterium]
MANISTQIEMNYREKICEEVTIESDSRIWNEFKFRQGDVIVASYHKAGTTVTQQIVSQLIFNGKENIPVWQISPWLDFRLLPKNEILEQLSSQTHCRFIKTHLTADALPIKPKTKYIYIARDGRDIAWSFHRHLRNAKDEFNQAQWKNFDPDSEILKAYPIIPDDPRQFFSEWLKDDGFPHGSFFNNVRSWWNIKHLTNVMLIHYNNVLEDLTEVILKIADFLEFSKENLNLEQIVRNCSFDYMKAHSQVYTPMGGEVFIGGHSSFFYKGTNNRWEGILSSEEIRNYENIAEERLGNECSRWLKTGVF